MKDIALPARAASTHLRSLASWATGALEGYPPAAITTLPVFKPGEVAVNRI